MENGTVIVKIRTTEFDIRNIPHIVSLGMFGVLITMKGRPPISFRCSHSGHLRKDCTEKGASYASPVAESSTENQPNTSSPSNPSRVAEEQDPTKTNVAPPKNICATVEEKALDTGKQCA
ncbi:hypothetical protein ACJMK2_038801 [Sinanodonta woodiana]|uniref:CCHC-type domain-containing protein n=1 Tax=Sinanodonta woodiana TaxID=1069815 RepID=A0ABD3WDF4_SINWO